MVYPHIEEKPGNRVKRFLNDPIEISWHVKLLNLIRKNSDKHLDTHHFTVRAFERGILNSEIKALRNEGRPCAIETGSDNDDLDWKPKYILQLPRKNGQIIEGVYAVDGMNLRGITCYLREIPKRSGQDC
jgi:hypothetical protein